MKRSLMHPFASMQNSHDDNRWQRLLATMTITKSFSDTVLYLPNHNPSMTTGIHYLYSLTIKWIICSSLKANIPLNLTAPGSDQRLPIGCRTFLGWLVLHPLLRQLVPRLWWLWVLRRWLWGAAELKWRKAQHVHDDHDFPRIFPWFAQCKSFIIWSFDTAALMESGG